MIGSVPRFLRTAGSDFPAHTGYLRTRPARVAYWKERLAALPGRSKVGISWRGGAPSTRRSLRSIPLDEWRGVLRLRGVDFVSLQYTECGDEIADLARTADVRVHHWTEALADYEETAALVSALDLVISVQTAVVHLAGALGVPTWALVPETPEWRYGERGDTMPWYPSVKLVRKQRGEDWSGVLARVEERLAPALEDARRA
jgi:ADP-heptose:LPS heptosyltransferase